jgi:hypothetical protein
MTNIPRGAKPQVKGPQGLAGRPHFESVQTKTWRLHSHLGSQEYPITKTRWKQAGVAGQPAITSKPTQLSRWKPPSTSIQESSG